MKKLSINRNQQLILPDFLWNLKSLEILELCENNLTTIPKSIGKLKNFRELYLYENYMENFPKHTIEKLKKLKFIGLEKEKYLSKLDDKTIKWLKKY